MDTILPKSDRIDGNVPIYSSAGLSGFHSEAMVNQPTVVTGRYGTIGNDFFVEEPSWPHNTTLYVRDFKGNEPRFIFYALQLVNFYAYPRQSRRSRNQSKRRSPRTNNRAASRIAA